MATIKRFEDILSWQKARILNDKIGLLIDNGSFKSNYRLINQIEGSAGSIMDNIAEGFERSGIKNLFNFFTYLKALAENCGRNYIEHWIASIYTKTNLMNSIMQL